MSNTLNPVWADLELFHSFCEKNDSKTLKYVLIHAKDTLAFQKEQRLGKSFERKKDIIAEFDYLNVKMVSLEYGAVPGQRVH